MKLIYATTNVSKLDMMSNFLTPLGIEICGLSRDLPDIPESGNQPLDNARQKALAYFDILQQPLFSCDSGLFIDGLPHQLQPGTNVRVVNGKRLSDEEMIEHYSDLANRYGKLTARYKNAICLVLDKNSIIQYDGDDLSGEKFFISGQPHPKRKQGFPIDSLSIHISTNKYYFDLPAKQRGVSFKKGFQDFFKKYCLNNLK